MSEIQLDQISGLKKSKSGVWYSNQVQDISFPANGNEKRRTAEVQSFWYEHRNQCILRLMQNHPPSGPVFDIGGGNGTVSLAIQEGGFDVCLLEPEMAGVRDAMQKGIGTVICSTFDAAAFSKGGLPAVGLFDVLEHIKEDGEFLVKVHDALEPKGKVFLTVPALESLWSEADDNSGHYRRYTNRGLSTLFDEIGFKVLYVSYFFTVLIPPIFLLRSIPYKFSMSRSDPDWRHQHHQDKRGVSGSLLLSCMRWEQFMIKHQKAMPFGSSCILVAEKCDMANL